MLVVAFCYINKVFGVVCACCRQIVVYYAFVVVVKRFLAEKDIFLKK